MPKLPISSASATTLTLDGKRVVSFGGCNYLGLSFHPGVQAALVQGMQQFGISTSASRQTTGNTTAHDRLEELLGSFLKAESAIVVPDGYTANLAAAQALARTHRVSLIDARCHRSIREAVKGVGMTLVEYRHLDARDAAAKLGALAKGTSACVWTDGVFASDGSVAPVPELLAAAQQADATLVIDDCHGFCTLGDGGRGTLSHFGLASKPLTNVVITTTLAKGLGCHGGTIAGTAELVSTIRSHSIAYICTTPVSPAIATAAAEALAVVQGEPDRIERLRKNVTRLGGVLRAMNLPIAETPAPIFTFTLPTRSQMEEVHQGLIQQGFLAPLSDYPDGPAPCYFRLSASSEHTPEQIDAFAATLSRLIRSSATPQHQTKHARPAHPV